MFPLFVDLQDEKVFIFGHSPKAVEYAKTLSQVAQVIYFSFQPMDPMTQQILEDLPNCQIYEKKIPLNHLTSSKLLVAASEHDQLNTTIIKKVLGRVPFIAAVRPYAGVNVFLGDYVKSDGLDLGLFSKSVDQVKDEIIQVIDSKNNENHVLLDSIVELLEESNRNVELSVEEQNYLSDLPAEELLDLKEEITEEYLLDRTNVKIAFFEEGLDKEQVNLLAKAIQDRFVSDGIQIEVETVELKDPFEAEKIEDFQSGIRDLQNNLMTHQIDLLLAKENQNFDLAPGIKKLIGLNKREPLTYYLIGEIPVDHFLEIEPDSKVGSRDFRVLYYIREQEKMLAKLYHDEDWNFEKVETFSDPQKALQEIGLAYDYLVINSLEFKELGLSEQELNEKGFYLTQIDMTPIFEQPVINAYSRKTDTYLNKFLSEIQDRPTQKAVIAQQKLFEELFDSIYSPDGCRLYTYAEFDPKTSTYYLEILGDREHEHFARVKLEGIKEKDLTKAIRKVRSIANFDLNYGTGQLLDYTRRHLSDYKNSFEDRDLQSLELFTVLQNRYEEITRVFKERLEETFSQRIQQRLTDLADESGIEVNDRSQQMISMLTQKELDEKLKQIDEEGIEVFVCP